MWKCACILLSTAAADYWVPPASSGINREVHVKTNSEPVQFHEHEHKAIPHKFYNQTFHTSYLSHPITLMTGEAWFTLPDITVLPMPNPGKPYAIIGMAYDIVDENNRSVPLNELYMHHWLVYDTATTGTGWDMGCGGTGQFVSNIYGAGAEMRGMTYAYPDGFGYISKTGKQWWSANLHFINTQDLSTSYFNGSHGAALKSCVECEYAPGKAPLCVPGLDSSAIFACCVAGARCPVNKPGDQTKKKYYLQSNITWTTNVEKVKPVRTVVLDGVPCDTVMNMYPNKKHKGTVCDDKICMTNVTRQAPFTGTIMWAYDHQHLGALNSTLFINGKKHCSGYPHTGTDPHMHPGNEQGYIVGFEMCINPDRPSEYIHINKGDDMTLVAYYSIDPEDNTSFPIPGGSHTGIMNLFYHFVAEDVPESVYVCQNNKCVPSAEGVPIDVCQAACGPQPGPAPPSPSPSPGKCTISRGMNNGGHNIKEALNISSTEDCCSECIETDGCVGFTFVHGGFLRQPQCWLKDKLWPLSKDSAVDSGSINATAMPSAPSDRRWEPLPFV